MKNRMSNLYFVFIFLILIAGVMVLGFISYHKNSKEQEYVNENIFTLDIAYHASIDKYRLLTRYIFDESIKTKRFFSLFEKGVHSEDEIRQLYKGLLYKELYPLYLKLKKVGIRQFHFHLKNNVSYIRFHKPSKYGDDLSEVRETIRIANKENKIVSNFETGRVISGFRNVFPLNYENEHLGSVEISVSTKMMIESILKLDNRREYSFILNKDVVFPKLFKSQDFLYETAVINSNFVIEDMDASLPDSPKKLSAIANKINKKLSENKELKKMMHEGEKYGILVDIEDEYYDVTFIPMLGVSKKIEGYLIGYKKSKNIPVILKIEVYLYSAVILGMIVMIVMILMIKRKENTVARQKEWFKSITDGLEEGLYVMDLNAKINYINPIACKILGYEEKEVLGKNAHTLFHSHSLNDNLAQKDCPIFCSVIKDKVFSSKKEFFLTSKGKNIPVSLKSRLIVREDKVSEIVTSFSDISIQQKLEEKGALLTKALESSINCVVITDIDAVVQWVNPAFENLTGYRTSEVIGKNPKEFIHSGEQSQGYYADMWKTILSKKPWRGEIVNRKKDGTLYDEELIITPVLDENDEIVNFVAVKQDITHRKLLALEKEEKDKLFFQQSKMAAMGEMLGNIAHQWRQPLSLISIAATGAKLQNEMNILNKDNLNNTMDRINNSAQYLSQTIDDFRGYFDPKNSKITNFLISDLIDKTLKLVRSQFIDRDIKIVQKIEDVSIQSLENELIQVLVNILNNARDALIHLKDRKRLIFIDTYIKEKTLFIEIKDNADGIKADIIDRVFEPYFTTKHQSQGTGIGLYMCQDIIKSSLDGTITVKNDTFTYDNTEYNGAKFIIKLSVARLDKPDI